MTRALLIVVVAVAGCTGQGLKAANDESLVCGPMTFTRGVNPAGENLIALEPIEGWAKDGRAILNVGGDTEEVVDYHVELWGPGAITVSPLTKYEHDKFQPVCQVATP